MIERDAAELERVIERIKTQAAAGAFRVTQHAQQEMVEEEIGLDEVLETVGRAEILEHYPEHRRGACCLTALRTRGVRFTSFAPSSSLC